MLAGEPSTGTSIVFSFAVGSRDAIALPLRNCRVELGDIIGPANYKLAAEKAATYTNSAQ
jgi:hypothetical protein